MSVKINDDWTFEEFCENIEAVKSQIKEVLASFLWYETKKRVLLKSQLKRKVYSFHYPIWQRDKIWTELFCEEDENEQ